MTQLEERILYYLGDKDTDEEQEPLPPLPVGGYFKGCCPDWNTTHVVPVYKKGALIWWECSHCGLEHYADALKQWDDIPF